MARCYDNLAIRIRYQKWLKIVSVNKNRIYVYDVRGNLYKWVYSRVQYLTQTCELYVVRINKLVKIKVSTCIHWFVTANWWILKSNYWFVTLNWWILKSNDWFVTLNWWILKSNYWFVTFNWWILKSNDWFVTLNWWILKSNDWFVTLNWWLHVLG